MTSTKPESPGTQSESPISVPHGFYEQWATLPKAERVAQDHEEPYASALAELRRRGYGPMGVHPAPYGHLRTGSLVATLRHWQGRWIVSDYVGQLHSFSNLSFDFRETIAWLMNGEGVGCPLVLLEDHPEGLLPTSERHMPAPGWNYHLGVMQRPTINRRCGNPLCGCLNYDCFHEDFRKIERPYCCPEPLDGCPDPGRCARCGWPRRK